jgi:hypothetical protein
VQCACPVPVVYAAATMGRAADELEALPPGSTLGVMLADYGRLRAAARACAGDPS